MSRINARLMRDHTDEHVTCDIGYSNLYDTTAMNINSRTQKMGHMIMRGREHNIHIGFTITRGPVDQWTNGQADQSTIGSVDQWTS